MSILAIVSLRRYEAYFGFAFELKSPSRTVSMCPYSPYSPYLIQYIDFFILFQAIYCIVLYVGIIGHKVFHGVLREEFLELTIELTCQRLVVTDDQRGLIKGCDHIGHGKGLT